MGATRRAGTGSRDERAPFPRGASLATTRDTLFATPGTGDARFVFDRRVAAVFDDMAARSIPGYHETRALAVDVLAQRVPQEGHVVDLGTSTGTFPALLLERRPDLRVTAVDASAAMIDEARLRLEACGDSVRLQVADVATWTPPPCDAVVSLWTLQFIDPALRASTLDRIAAALAPDGTLVLAEKLVCDDPVLEPLWERIYHEHKRRNGYSQTEIDEKKRALEGVLRPWTEAAWRSALDQAGMHRAEGLSRWGPFFALVARRRPGTAPPAATATPG